MSVYRRNVTDTKYDRLGTIDVFALTDEDLFETDTPVCTSRYLRDECLYTSAVLDSIEDQEHFEADGAELTAWKIFEGGFLSKSRPLKVARWTSFRERGEDGDGGSYLNEHGRVMTSFDELVRTMPDEAMDAVITVQAKLNRDLPRCAVCYDDDGTSVQRTSEEIQRHNLHIVDNMMSVVPYEDEDEKNLFLGQEGQVTTQRVLRDVLIERSYTSEGMMVCVAQVNIYSKEDSGTAATISKTGKVVIEGDESQNKAPLAALLPWLRLPSFILPTGAGSVDIQAINFWMCPEETQTNTHFDGHHNILMVLHGVKSVEMSPPGGVRGSPVHGSHANHPFLLRCTNVGGHLRHQDFAYDTGFLGNEKDACNDNIVVPVAAGDAIFIPEGWWHRVESSKDCVAVNVWFDHKGSSLSTVVHEKNPHQLPYQAREAVRLYVDAHIDDLNKFRRNELRAEMISQIGFGAVDASGWSFGWKREPGQPIRSLFDEMGLYRLTPKERTNEEIVNGMGSIERYAAQILGVVDIDEPSGLGHVPRLRRMALHHAVKYLGDMISLFVTA